MELGDQDAALFILIDTGRIDHSHLPVGLVGDIHPPGRELAELAVGPSQTQSGANGARLDRHVPVAEAELEEFAGIVVPEVGHDVTVRDVGALVPAPVDELVHTDIEPDHVAAAHVQIAVVTVQGIVMFKIGHAAHRFDVAVVHIVIVGYEIGIRSLAVDVESRAGLLIADGIAREVGYPAPRGSEALGAADGIGLLDSDGAVALDGLKGYISLASDKGHAVVGRGGEVDPGDGEHPGLVRIDLAFEDKSVSAEADQMGVEPVALALVRDHEPHAKVALAALIVIGKAYGLVVCDHDGYGIALREIRALLAVIEYLDALDGGSGTVAEAHDVILGGTAAGTGLIAPGDVLSVALQGKRTPFAVTVRIFVHIRGYVLERSFALAQGLLILGIAAVRGHGAVAHAAGHDGKVDPGIAYDAIGGEARPVLVVFVVHGHAQARLQLVVPVADLRQVRAAEALPGIEVESAAEL